MSVTVGSFLVQPGFDGVVASLPFTPTAAIFWTVDQSADGYLSHANFAGYTGDTCLSVGVADKATGAQQCVLANSDQQAFAPFNRSGRATFTDRIVAAQRAPSASIPSDYLVLASWDACGWHFTVTGTSSYRVYYMAFAGSTLNMASGVLTLPADGSNGSVAGLSFNPSANPSLLLCVSGFGTDDTGDGLVSVGAADGVHTSRSSFWDIFYNARGGAEDATTGVVLLTGYTAALVSFNAAGFTLSQSVARGVTTPVLYLLLTDAGASFRTDRMAWPSAPVSVTDPGFQPDGVFYYTVGHDPGEATAGALSIGAVGASPLRTVAASAAGVADVNDQRRWTAEGTDTGQVLLTYTANTGVLYADMRVTALTANGFDATGTNPALGGLPIRYAAIKLSTADTSPCNRHLLPILGVGS